MTKVLTDPKYYTAIANAIRAKNGSTTTYKPSGMADAITALTTSSNGGTAGHTVTLKQTEHQTIRANVSLPSKTFSSSAEADVAFVSDPPNVHFYMVSGLGYWVGNLVINGEKQTNRSVTVSFDKDYVVSATNAIKKADSYAAMNGLTLAICTGVSTGHDSTTNYNLTEDSGTWKATLSEADASIMQGLVAYPISATLTIVSPIEVTFEGTTIIITPPATSGYERVLFSVSEEEAKRILANLLSGA